MIYSIIEQLEKTSSTNAKLDILRANSQNELLKEFFNLALNPHIQFYIRKIPEYDVISSEGIVSLDDAFKSLSVLSNRTATGHSAINYLQQLLSNLSTEDANILERVIKKDPKCGVSTETVNKVWTKLIPSYQVLLASAFDEKLEDKFDWENGVIIQEKSDGLRCNIVIRDYAVQVFTRSGKELHVQGRFDSLVTKHKLNNIMIDGELVASKDGEVLDRQASNGIGNKINQNTATKEECDMMSLYCWDVISIEEFDREYSPTPYEVRFETLRKIVDEVEGLILIDSWVVHSKEEARAIYKRLVSQGKEGTLIKARDMEWENKRSKKQMKAKEVIEAEFICVGVEEGTKGTKNEGRLGAIIVETSCGKLRSNCGSGFTDEQRVEYWNNKELILNKVVTLEFNKLSKNKNNNDISLFLPIFIEVRFDKETANTYEEVLAETKK